MLRSLPNAVKFDLSEGKYGMKFKDEIFRSHRKIRYLLKKQHLCVELQDGSLDDETGTFLG